MILVELYSKDECHLCDEAREVLETVRVQIPFTLHEIKLTAGEQYYEEYQEDVPVVHINKRLAFKHRLNEHLVKIRLQQELSETDHRAVGDPEETPIEEPEE